MTPDLPLTLYVDRSCPLCAREVRWLERQADPSAAPAFELAASPRRRTALCGKMCCSVVQAQSGG